MVKFRELVEPMHAHHRGVRREVERTPGGCISIEGNALISEHDSVLVVVTSAQGRQGREFGRHSRRGEFRRCDSEVAGITKVKFSIRNGGPGKWRWGWGE